jgi:hypothetical protein
LDPALTCAFPFLHHAILKIYELTRLVKPKSDEVYETWRMIVKMTSMPPKSVTHWIEVERVESSDTSQIKCRFRIVIYNEISLISTNPKFLRSVSYLSTTPLSIKPCLVHILGFISILEPLTFPTTTLSRISCIQKDSLVVAPVCGNRDNER